MKSNEMKRRLLILALLLGCIPAAAASPGNIIPLPDSTALSRGSLRVSGIALKCDPRMDSTAVRAVTRFAAELSLACGRTCPVSSPVGIDASVENGNAKGMIFLLDRSLAPDEYRIETGSRRAVVYASGAEGFIHSIQTLKQLLPASLSGAEAAEGGRWALPCCTISDRPDYGYRGLMLDCSRHFWSTDEIRRCLDMMEKFKLNRFHWHLTDDQGWRIEIKPLPLLTSMGSWREGTETDGGPGSSDHVRYGGFYTQDDIRDIVSYAADRGISVIPEITMPGHFLAALSAYPETGCSGGPYQTATGWGTSSQLICAGKEQSYAFLETVISEVAGLFPSEYINIGCYDCPVSEWEECPDCQAKIAELGFGDGSGLSTEERLLGYFTERVVAMLAAEGKKAICRDEALEWTDPGFLEDNGALIMRRNGNITEVSSGGEVIGLQEDIWTESISSPEQLERKLTEILPGLSEKQWRSGDRPSEKNK